MELNEALAYQIFQVKTLKSFISTATDFIKVRGRADNDSIQCQTLLSIIISSTSISVPRYTEYPYLSVFIYRIPVSMCLGISSTSA